MTSSSFGPPGVLDFFCELKRILTSLTEVASLIQHVNSEENMENDMEGEDPEVMVRRIHLIGDSRVHRILNERLILDDGRY